MPGKGGGSAVRFTVFMRKKKRKEKNKKYATSDMFFLGILINAIFRRKKIRGYKTEACIKT